MAIPGGSFILLGNKAISFSVPTLGLIWVLVAAQLRILVTPSGFTITLIGLISLFVSNIIYGIVVTIKNRKNNIPEYKASFVLLTCLTTYVLCIFGFCHQKKASLLGIDFYHIPSSSMSPTLNPGDVILIDTWKYISEKVNNNDLVVIDKKGSGFIIAKRVADTKNSLDGQLVYVTGDNTHHSIDSRNYGWLKSTNILGKIQFVWFSFTNSQRYLKVIH